MKIRLTALSILSIFLMAFSVSNKVAKKADKAITKFYDVDSFTKEFIDFSQKESIETLVEFSSNNFFKIIKDGEMLGYAYIGNAPSKTATFDYLVLFDKDFIITKSKVLIYREEYGGEIGSRRWLKQFIGKNQDDHMQHGKDIIAISGATISTTSMTKAINNLLASIKILHNKELL